MRHRQEYSRANCTFSPPLDTNILYQVVEGEVTDQTGQVVEGVEAWDDGGDPSVCGIRILEMQDYHGEEEGELNSEPWKITLSFNHGGIHGQELLSKIQVGIHIKDDNFLRPQFQDWFGFQPVHYSLSIMPDLLMENQTISFSGVADVRTGVILLAF